MTRCITCMRTHYTWLRTWLFAYVGVGFTHCRMAYFYTFVAPTFQLFITWHTTAEVFLATRDYIPLFVTAMTIFLRECHAWRAVLSRMTYQFGRLMILVFNRIFTKIFKLITIMCDFVITRMLSGAWTITRRFLEI